MAKLVNIANKVLRLIKRTYSTQPHVRLKLYIHFVRPHTECDCQVWSPHQQFLIHTIERVERRATKLILKDRPYVLYRDFVLLLLCYIVLSYVIVGLRVHGCACAVSEN